MDDRDDRVRAKLLQKYASTEQGRWKIFGEDSNADLGGSHFTPLLEEVTGTYANVVEYALQLDGFYQWGGGGDIERSDPPPPQKFRNVDNVKSLAKLRDLKDLKEQKAELQTRLLKVEKEIASLGVKK